MIVGDLSITENMNLTNISGLDNIYPGSINDLNIVDNASLSVCDITSICEYLGSPGGAVNIQNNAPGCNSPEEVEVNCTYHCLPEGISFSTQAEIDSFQVNYPNCVEIEGNATIQGDNITNLNGLSVLISIGGNLKISNNDSLSGLTGLNNLSFIGGNLEIYHNHALTSLSGLENLNTISSMFRIESCYVLSTTAGLDSLSSIGGNVKIYHNDSLLSLEGLSNLTSIGGYLKISNNDVLSVLSGLDSVTSIGGSLWILNHIALISLAGIDNIDTASINELRILNNDSLSICNVQSVCDYLTSANASIVILYNATGCSNQEEVEEACFTFIEEISVKNKFTISPNPLN